MQIDRLVSGGTDTGCILLDDISAADVGSGISVVGWEDEWMMGAQNGASAVTLLMDDA